MHLEEFFVIIIVWNFLHLHIDKVTKKKKSFQNL